MYHTLKRDKGENIVTINDMKLWRIVITHILNEQERTLVLKKKKKKCLKICRSVNQEICSPARKINFNEKDII